MLLITVVLKTTIPYDDSTALFEYGFNNFSYVNIASSETRYSESTGSGSDVIFDMGDSFVELDSDAEIILPDNASIADTTVEISYDSAQDDTLGTLTYTYDGRTVGTADVVVTRSSGDTYEFGNETVNGQKDSDSEESVASSSNSRRGSRRLWRRFWRSRIKWLVIIVIIVVVILIVFRRVIQQMRRRRRRRKRRAQYGSRSSGSSSRSSSGSSSRSGSGSSSRSGSRSGSGSSSRSGSGSSSKNRRR